MRHALITFGASLLGVVVAFAYGDPAQTEELSRATLARTLIVPGLIRIKSLKAREQNCPGVQHQREQWKARQVTFDPENLVVSR